MATATDFVCKVPGGYGPQASIELATQIDAGTKDVPRLMAFGFSAPLAAELGSQLEGGTGNVSNLMALGVPPSIATIIKAAIDA